VIVAPPRRIEAAELVVDEGAGTLAAAAVPFMALARSWKAVKFLSLVSTALMALSSKFGYLYRCTVGQDTYNTIPAPQ
jgi:hypothetical protein